jgi:hypothetical protein
MDNDFYPPRTHDTPARRPVEYYVRRLREGVRAYRQGTRGTPLTRALERWMDHQLVLSVGGHDVPGAWEAYGKVFWEYVDAIDAEGDLAPYRFQKTGEIWAVHFTVEGVVTKGLFKDHRGFQHYAQLLANQDRRVESVQLAGEADEQTLELLQRERGLRQRPADDAEIEKLLVGYRQGRARVDEALLAAEMSGDADAVEGAERQRDEFVAAYGKDERAFRRRVTEDTQRSSLSLTFHKAVGTAMRRALRTLKDGNMGECATFLKRNVNPEGMGYAYRPSPFAPPWLL